MIIQREVNPMVFETRCIGQSVAGQYRVGDSDRGPCTNDVSLIFGIFDPPLPLSVFLV